MPEQAAPYFVFHIDHIIARQHLDKVIDDPESLAWACSNCNYHKGPNLTSIDPATQLPTPLFNPRTDTWRSHFKLEKGQILGLTPVGRATARLLAMNSPRLVRLRRDLTQLGEF